jgi:ABC-type branched-subunit amino acid transport system substrate-binding protein
VITVLSGGGAVVTPTPEVGYAAQAAAAAITKSCELGRPLQIVVCDSKNNPNDGAACGREMVSQGVIAYTAIDEQGTSWFPITSAAKIPEIGGNGLDSLEVASPLWFPLAGNIHDALTLTTIAASGVGKVPVKLDVIEFAAPGVSFFNAFFKQQITALGGSYGVTISVPPTATDMSPYAQQIISSGANAVVPIISGNQYTSLVTSLVQQGKPLTQLVMLALGNQETCQFQQQLGSSANGLWISDNAWPVAWNTTSPGAMQYVSELTAAGLPHGSCQVSEYGAQTWAAVHIMADAMKGSPTMNSATLIQKLNTLGPINNSALAGTVNFSQNAFPSNPVLSKLRIFSNEFIASRVGKDGKPAIVTTSPVPIGQKFAVPSS